MPNDLYGRDSLWSSLDGPWDILIIGGGITGAGILSEAQKSGYKTLLVEKRDFASGTSSRSSKLVHGGLRYLRNGQVKLTFESVRERQRLLSEARGLVNPLSFVMANYQRDPYPGWVFGCGLALYDALGLCWRHKKYNPADLLEICPGLQADGLTGGYRYFDAVTDDARLVYRIIMDASQTGARAINYTSIINLLKDSRGAVCGVIAQDETSPNTVKTKEIHARVVINASGIWTDRIRKQVGASPRIRKLRGSHLVFSASRLPLSRAVSVMHPIDSRPVFAIPWEGVTLFGTTDMDHQGLSDDEPVISSSEIEYLLVGVKTLFPAYDLSYGDIQTSFSGIRSVIDSGKVDPCKESREHVIWEENGLITVTGGKLTTYRLMACQALELARRRLKLTLEDSRPPQHFNNPETDSPHERDNPLAVLNPPTRLRLAGRYGPIAPDVLQSAQPGEMDCIPGTQTIWAELRWAARTENVIHLDDLLLRRTRLGVLLPHGGKGILNRVKQIVQAELHWDENRWDEECSNYLRLWDTCYHCP